MKQVLLGLGLVLGLAGCDAATDTAAENTIVAGGAAAQFFDKSLVAENGTTFLFNPDGTVGGVFNGAAIDGTYTASASEICSSYTSPAALTGREFCSTPEIDGDTVVFNRRDGTTSQPYTITDI